MIRRRHTVDEDGPAGRLANALDAPGLTTDDAVNEGLAVARALAPTLYPREAWRIALKAKMNAEFSRPRIAGAEGAGTRDGASGTFGHVTQVVDPDLGMMTLSDVEAIDETRAAEVAAAMARIRARQR